MTVAWRVAAAQIQGSPSPAENRARARPSKIPALCFDSGFSSLPMADADPSGHQNMGRRLNIGATLKIDLNFGDDRLSECAPSCMTNSKNSDLRQKLG